MIPNPMMGGMNPMQLLAQFKQNPMQFFAQRKLNVPQNLMNDPQAIINHLMQTGQVNQSQVNAAYRALQQFGGK
jgi:hypothetical protein